MRRLIPLLSAAACLGAAELAPSADQGGLPDLAPRFWFDLNIAPDDQSVAAQVPRRRETVIGASRQIDAERGLGVHVEGIWSPVRAARAEPPVRTDELLFGIGGNLERPGERFAWRLAATGGVRILTDLHTAEFDRGEHRILRGEGYQSEGQEEDPDDVAGLLSAHWTGRLRVTDSDPLREKPVEAMLDARVIRLLPFDGNDDGDPDLRLSFLVLLPSRTTAGWFGLTWQRLAQPDGGSRAVAAVSDLEDGWWFSSGGALRLGADGSWLVEVGSAVDLASGVAVGTLGVVRSEDKATASHDGTSSLEFVLMRGDAGTSAGIASGDQLKKSGGLELRSEIRTLLGERSEPAGAVAADAVRLDALLRGQATMTLGEKVRLGPEAALGLGLRRDAVEFPGNTYAFANRVVLTGDIGVAGRVSTSWNDGIASLGVSLGWGWWTALGGDEQLSEGGQTIDLHDADDGLILRAGLLATF